MNERLITAIWILTLIYLAYRIFANKKGYYKPKDEVEEILRSDKYKVKGQHDN
jgi:hypothetical protein